jgi:hypothetical protein
MDNLHSAAERLHLLLRTAERDVVELVELRDDRLKLLAQLVAKKKFDLDSLVGHVLVPQ